VLSIYLFSFGGFAPLGGLLAGWLSDVGGTQLAFLVAGVACLAMTVYTFLAWPRPASEAPDEEHAEHPLAA